jgi:hypothetical protein
MKAAVDWRSRRRHGTQGGREGNGERDKGKEITKGSVASCPYHTVSDTSKVKCN